MIVFWLGIIFLVVWGLRAFGNTTSRDRRPERTSTSLEIAQQRYARGELSRDEYLALVDDLLMADGANPKTKRSER